MIAERLNKEIIWSNYQDLTGKAVDVGYAIEALLASKDVKSAETAQWRLENRIVVQGSVYNAAVPATRVFVASLVEDRPLLVRISVLELLYLILSGCQAQEEDAGRDIIEECRLLAKEGLWLIIKEFVHGSRDAARDVLEYIGTDLKYDNLVS